MRCQHCGKRLPILRKLTDSEFCSPAHRKSFQEEQERQALARLLEASQQGGGTKKTLEPRIEPSAGGAPVKKLRKMPVPAPDTGPAPPRFCESFFPLRPNGAYAAMPQSELARMASGAELLLPEPLLNRAGGQSASRLRLRFAPPVPILESVINAAAARPRPVSGNAIANLIPFAGQPARFARKTPAARPPLHPLRLETLLQVKPVAGHAAGAGRAAGYTSPILVLRSLRMRKRRLVTLWVPPRPLEAKRMAGRVVPARIPQAAPTAPATVSVASGALVLARQKAVPPPRRVLRLSAGPDFPASHRLLPVAVRLRPKLATLTSPAAESLAAA
jgi:hypothetical protein